MGRQYSILVRHGEYDQLPETPSAHQPFALNDQGMVQTRTGARKLKAMVCANQWTLHPVLHSSSLLRAWQTASILLDELDELHSIQQTDQLAERSVGAGANLTMSDITEIIERDPRYESLPGDWKANSEFRLPFIGAESLAEAGERVARYVESVMDELPKSRHDDCAVVFVGHGAAIRHAAWIMGALERERVAELSMHHVSPVALEKAADGTWRHVQGEWKHRSNAESRPD